MDDGELERCKPLANLENSTFTGDVRYGDAETQPKGKPGIYTGYVWLSDPEEWINPGIYRKTKVEYKFDNVAPSAPVMEQSTKIDEDTNFEAEWSAPAQTPISGIEQYNYSLTTNPDASTADLDHHTDDTSLTIDAEDIRNALVGESKGKLYLHVQAVSGALVKSKTTTMEIKVGDTKPDNPQPSSPDHNSSNYNSSPSESSENQISTPTVALSQTKSKAGIAKLFGKRIKLDRKGQGKITLTCKSGTSGCKGKVRLKSPVQTGLRTRKLATIHYDLASGEKKTMTFQASDATMRILRKDRNINGGAIIALTGVTVANASNEHRQSLPDEAPKFKMSKAQH
jgi:hypothetical protein